MADGLLVDSSVWVDHLRNDSRRLRSLLEAGSVRVHPFVIGELACGNPARRSEILEALAALPQAPVVQHAHVLELCNRKKLMGRGLRWIDISLLASAIAGKLALGTLDRRLGGVASALGLGISRE